MGQEDEKPYLGKAKKDCLDCYYSPYCSDCVFGDICEQYSHDPMVEKKHKNKRKEAGYEH